MSRWFVGQRDTDGHVAGIGFDDQEEAYMACGAFNKGFREGRAIDHHKILACSAAVFMDRPCKKFLPCPRFTCNKDICFYIRCLGQPIQTRFDLRAASDNPLALQGD